MIALFSTWLSTQVLFAALAFASRWLPQGRPRATLVQLRLLWCVGLLAVPLLALVPRTGTPFTPPTQVWSGESQHGIVTLTLPEVTAPVAVEARTLEPWAWLFGSILATATAMGTISSLRSTLQLRRILGGAVVLHRIGRVRVAVSSDVRVPFAAWTPRASWVVLDVETACNPESLALALRHEVQHHRNGDPLWAWVLAAARPLLLAAGPFTRLLREAEELAADDAVARHPRTDRRAYASLLVETAERALPALLPALNTPPLHRRIDMLLAPRHPPYAALRTALVALTIPSVLSAAWAADGLVADHRVDAKAARAAAARIEKRDGFVVPVNEAVLDALSDLAATPRGRAFVAKALDRKDGPEDTVAEALADYGLPPQLAAIPLVESGYANMGAPGVPTGPSYAPGANGAGYWMFIPSTARAYGLRVDEVQDDRLDLLKETDAATHLLSDLHDQLGDWPLAISAYNQGQRTVKRAIATEGTRDAWELQERGALNDYTAHVYAAMLILEDPTLAR